MNGHTATWSDIRIGAKARSITAMLGASACFLASTAALATPLAPLSLKDMVYFGAVWQLLNGKPEQTAPIVLGNGYQNPIVVRSSDGQFFYGVVEKAAPNGTITDVVLAFAGAAGAPDFVEAQAINLTLPTAQGAQATAVFDQLMADPRYADAVIHVSGHSLGAGLTQFILGHSLATYGQVTTRARAHFLQFAPPPWGQAIADRFNVPRAAFDGHISGYVAQNDPVQSLVDQGATQLGNLNYLAPYHVAPLLVGVSNISSHFPTTFIDALGLPEWMSTADQAAARAAVAVQSPTPLASDYGPVDGVKMVMVGDSSANVLRGSSAGDVLIGKGGQDLLRGGLGADLFVFDRADASLPAAPDLIADFSPSQGDRIDLRGISRSGASSWWQPVQFIGSAALSGPGQVRSWNDGSTTWVEGAFGAGTAVTMRIKLSGALILSASDFVLNDGVNQPQYTVGFVAN